MNAISKAKKLQAMPSFKNQYFYYNLIFHSFLALTCSLLCSCPLWFPYLCSSTKQFLFLSLPNKFSSFFGPKCLFILVNIIVVFLVGESRLVGSQSSPVGEIYEHYVERSRSLRGVSAHQDKAGERTVEVNDQEARVQDKVVVLMKEEDDREATELTNELGDKDIREKFEEEGNQHEEKEINKEEESGLPPEELNRKVEEFIARVNKQRWLEARLFVCCNA